VSASARPPTYPRCDWPLRRFGKTIVPFSEAGEDGDELKPGCAGRE
jgi:hypothetical protein